jgi:ribosomal protein S18 acetylase RimI-like enzyme
MTPSLHRATPQEADACYGLLRSYAETMDLPLGSVSWTHPQAEAFVHADAAAGRLYAVREGATLAATFALCDAASPRFAAVQWAEPRARAGYLHRLAVAESLRGCGIGKWCTAQAEQIAAARGYTYLRLDSLPTDERAVTFYRRLGYADRGIIQVESGEPRQPLVDLVCFEKRLSEPASEHSARAS